LGTGRAEVYELKDETEPVSAASWWVVNRSKEQANFSPAISPLHRAQDYV